MMNPPVNSMMTSGQQQGTGLLSQGAASPQGQPAQQQQPQPGQQDVQVSPSTAESKEDYERFVALGLELISSPKTRRSMETVLATGDPVQALANALGAILRKIDSASRVRGIEVDDHVKLFAAFELLQRLHDVGKAIGKMDLDKDHLELAFAVAVQDYIKDEIAAGRIDPEELQRTTKRGMEEMTPEQRNGVKESMARLQQTGQKYSGGQP